MPSVRSFDSNGGGTSSTVVTKPAGVVSGDYLVAFLMCRDQGVTWTLPSGFTLLNSHVDHASDTELAGAIAYKQAGGSEPASYTFSQSGVGIGTGCILVAVQDTDGIVDSNIAADNTLDSTADSPDITPSDATNLLLRGFVAERNASSIVPYFKEPTGYTEVGEFRSSFSRISIQVSSKVAGSITATGVVQATTYSNVSETSPTSIYTIGSVIEFKPATAGRFEAGSEFRGLLNKDFHIAFGRFEVGAEFRGEFYWNAEGRFEVSTEFDVPSVLQDHTANGRFEVASQFASSLSREFHILSGRFEASVRMKDGYVGRGTGLTWTFPASVDPSEEGAYELNRFLSQLREGDEFPGFIPLAGVNGKTGRLRVLARRYNDALETPDLEVQFIEYQDPEIINRLKEDTVIPFIPKRSGNFSRNIIELRRERRNNG